MILIAKLLRTISSAIDIFRTKILIKYYSLKYQNCDLTGTRIGRRVTIVCTDDSKLILKNCCISNGVTIKADHGGYVKASNCFFGENSIIVACRSIKIGSDSLLAEMVVVRDQNHRFSNSGKPLADQGFDKASIHIGSNVWLGAKVTVLAGSNIGDGTVIGAHSLVRGDIPHNCLAVGTPATVKKYLRV
ncbi:acyltransferase [Desulfopila inferna]|uniref:acyltransferase n=1 Tax=Desulfopila inferna TaxID=468528 RepID=UPI0019640D25|nr:acyltransferase [Desulfopila inferna]MBM9605789.1 acyltransferase [Desulfopila inferna]